MAVDVLTPVGAARPQGFWSLLDGDVRAWRRIWRPDRAEEPRLRGRDALWFLWNFPGLRATALYRLSHTLWAARLPAVPGMISRLNLMLHGFDVPPSVEIGPGLYVPHPVGTVVMAHRIGSGVSLISSITIGMRHTPAFPTIGNNVLIGAGARVLGQITIGDGASIGANAVVLQDVPPGATAVGVPAVIRPARTREQAP